MNAKSIDSNRPPIRQRDRGPSPFFHGRVEIIDNFNSVLHDSQRTKGWYHIYDTRSTWRSFIGTEGYCIFCAYTLSMERKKLRYKELVGEGLT